MRYFQRFTILIAALLAVIFNGCSARPTAQIERSQKAMEQAKSEFADVFAPEQWSAAEKAWIEAQDRLNNKKYPEANAKLLKAQQSFQQAREVAKGLREAAISEIKGQQKTIELRSQMLKDSIAGSGKKLKANQLKEFDALCAGIGERAGKVSDLLNKHQYADAKTLVANTLREVYDGEVKLREYTGGKK